MIYGSYGARVVNEVISIYIVNISVAVIVNAITWYFPLVHPQAAF